MIFLQNMAFSTRNAEIFGDRAFMQWFHSTVCSDTMFESVCNFGIGQIMGQSINTVSIILTNVIN